MSSLLTWGAGFTKERVISPTLSTSVGLASELDTIPATTPQKILMGKLSSEVEKR